MKFKSHFWGSDLEFGDYPLSLFLYFPHILYGYSLKKSGLYDNILVAEGEGFGASRLPLLALTGFGQRAHQLALCAMRCSLLVAPAPLQIPLKEEFPAEGEGFEPPCLVRDGGFQVRCLTVRLTLLISYIVYPFLL